MATLAIKSIRKSFGTVEVLNNINVDLEDGGFLVLLGPSGCGKSTLLSIIAGLETSSGGDIVIGGRNVNAIHPKDRNIAMVFQSYALYPTMSVRRNIGFGLEMRKVGADERDTAVQQAADLLQIGHLLDRKPGQLSGGQRQRVAMGRAIVRDPDLFLFDEPLSNLDAKLRVEMRTEIKRLHEQLGTTTVYVTHDQVEALTLGTQVAVMKGGIIQQLAHPETIYDRPANMFVAGFIGSPTTNFLRGTLARSDGGLQLHHAAGVLLLDRTNQDVDAYVGREVVAGIRPETLMVGEGSAALSGRVDVIEPTGPDTMVVVNVGGQMITARLGPKDRPATGATMSLSVDTAAINLFDPVSGDRI
ncbi:ABC transporter ATP-binding protein [Devosia sp.]|uniref:ABC transporter ATP-binding protein n=1 Tax=Devosia sp. TaxID=1871048 RepID=UPI003A904402